MYVSISIDISNLCIHLSLSRWSTVSIAIAEYGSAASSAYMAQNSTKSIAPSPSESYLREEIVSHRMYCVNYFRKLTPPRDVGELTL